jgi:predicted hotdog family 3-hydroxylacyl-ACP dehydratase
MTTSSVLPLDELVAHRGPMRLIDRVIEVSHTHAVAEADVRTDNLFFIAGRGVPAYVAIELLAQTIAAVDGFIRHDAGQPPKIGFLLGCRRYVARCPYISSGETLKARAEMIFADGAMFSFDCRIDDSVGEFAKARLNVYAPDQPAELLREDGP